MPIPSQAAYRRWPYRWLRRTAAAASLSARAAPVTLPVFIVLTFTTGVMPIGIAWATRQLINDLTRRAGLSVTGGMAAELAVLGVLLAVIPHLLHYLRAQMERGIGMVVYDRLFQAVNGLVGLARFEQPQFLDRLRLAQQASKAGPGQVVDSAVGVATATATIAGYCGTLLLLSPLMSLLVFASGIPVLLAEIALSKRRARMMWDIGPTERREYFYNQLLSTTAGAKEVRLFGLGSFLRIRMMTHRLEANQARRSVDRRELSYQTGLEFLAAAVAGGGLVWAASAAAEGRLSLGDVVLFIASVAGVQTALTTVATQVGTTGQALMLFDHYLAVTAMEPDLPVREHPLALPPLQHGIELRDVWFRYSPEHPWVLRGVDLRIDYGQTLALVGLNGAGKSTLVKLLCRFYDPTAGAILWDDVDIRDVDPVQLRQRISAVFQDFMHYEMTAAENISLGDLTSWTDRERVHQAARRAGIHAYLAALPRGYDTLLSRSFLMTADPGTGDTGIILSGGQGQRLALARALVRAAPQLMILDEPSAGLDASAEDAVRRALRAHRAGCTSMLISHRLAALRDADVIVVLRDGRIAEQGDHDALMELSGEYARLFALQGAGYQPATTARA